MSQTTSGSRFLGSLFGLCLLFAPLPFHSQARAGGELLPTNFVREQLVVYSYAGDPSGFTWLPDRRIILVSRIPGIVRITPVGSTVATAILTIPNVQGAGGEQGLLGVAVDPGWPARPYLYFAYTHTSGHSYVTMYTASGALSNPASTAITLSSPFHLLTDIPDQADNHNGGTLRFGPDGMLYFSMGDDADGCTSQDLTDLTGKILRLDVSSMPRAGTGPPLKADITPANNPFPGPNANTRLVWAWGLRNPFRFTIDAPTGDLFIGDVGEAAQDEIDRVRPIAAGANLGWPQREGLLDHACCGGCGTGNTFTDPIYVQPHSGAGNAVIGGPRMRFVSGPASMPASYDGSVFFCEFYEGWFRRLVPSGNSWVLAPAVPGQPSPSNWAQGLEFSSDLQLGPDGALYFCRMVGGSDRGVHRIRPITVTDSASLASSSRDVLQIAPNPLRVGTLGRLIYAGDPGVERSLDVLDARGRQLRSWSAANGAGGIVEWNGAGASGIPLASGIYFVRLREGTRTLATEKVTLLK